MRYEVVVKPRSKKEGLTRVSDKQFEIKINTPPIEGRANTRVIEILADFFGIPKSEISIVQGKKSKRKIIEISQLP